MARDLRERIPHETMCEQVRSFTGRSLVLASQERGILRGVGSECRLEEKRVVASLDAADGLETIASDVSFGPAQACGSLPYSLSVQCLCQGESPADVRSRTWSRSLVSITVVSVGGGQSSRWCDVDGLLSFVSSSSVMLDDSKGWRRLTSSRGRGMG